jgi:hypothetical protein
MMNTLLNKIITTKVGRFNFWLASIGVFFAVLVILLATSLRYNAKKLTTLKSNYVLINKRITDDMMGDIKKSSFKIADIDMLRQSGYFDSVQPIKTSLYKVKLKVPLNTIPLSTDMFFLSVPDAYLDVIPKNWAWKPGNTHLLGLAPRFMLDMYNTGFAIGQKTPQISEETVSKIPLDFYISNEDESKQIVFKGNIGGLSSRFTGIMVPESFMIWANNEFGFKQEQDPVGIVAKAKDPMSTAMNKFLESKGMYTDKGRFGAMVPYVLIFSGVTKYVGILFLTFALLMVLMFLQLTVVNAKGEIDLLKTLGTSPKQLESNLRRKFLPLYIYMVLAVLAVLSLAQLYIATHNGLHREEMYFDKILPWQVFIVAAIILGILVAINYMAIKHRLKDKKD